MKGTLRNQYKKFSEKLGRRITMSVYLLTGTDAEINAYKKSLEERGQEMQTDEATGKPIYFSPRQYGNTVDIRVSDYGSVYVEDKQMDAVEAMLDRTDNPVLQGAIASELAKALVASSGIVGSAPASTPATAPQAEAPAQSAEAPNLEE